MSGIVGGVAPAPEPGVVPGVGVLGVVVGIGVVRTGAGVPAAVPGAVAPVVPGVGLVELGSPGVAPSELGGGGPASGCPVAGGIFVVLIGSLTWPAPLLSVGFGFTMRGVGVSWLDVGALFPNGLR